ncbi:MAG: hypothetical protein ABW184_05645 [Sphingobium sp.]
MINPIIPLYWFLVLACWAFALKYGGATARWAFTMFLIATAMTVASIFVRLDLYRSNFILMAADGLYLVALYVIALRSRHYWPIWSAGFQLLTVLTHFGPILDPRASSKIYWGLESVWAIPMLVTMVAGIAKDRRIGAPTLVGGHERRPARQQRHGLQ